MKNSRALFVFFASYVLSIVLANVATNSIGLMTAFGLTFTAGTIPAGLALILRDGLQERSNTRAVLLAIVLGAALSFVTSSPGLALASGLAFLASEFVDLAVFIPVRAYSLPGAVIASSIVAAPVDTLLFLHLAGFPITFTTVSGQFIMKSLLALFVAFGIKCFISREA